MSYLAFAGFHFIVNYSEGVQCKFDRRNVVQNIGDMVYFYPL